MMSAADEPHLRRIEHSLLLYAHEMHEYTLQLWADSRKVAEEKKKAGRAAAASNGGKRAPKLVHAKSRIVDSTVSLVEVNVSCGAKKGAAAAGVVDEKAREAVVCALAQVAIGSADPSTEPD